MGVHITKGKTNTISIAKKIAGQTAIAVLGSTFFMLSPTIASPLDIDDTVNTLIESNMTQEVESAIAEQIETSLTETLEQKVVQQIDEQISEAIEQTIDKAVENRSLESVTMPVVNSAETLTQHSRLAVRDKQQKTLFYEVEVEDDWRAVEGEWLLFVKEAEAESVTRFLADAQISLLDINTLRSLGMQVLRVKVSENIDSYEEMAKRLPRDAIESWDRHHIYDYRPQAANSADKNAAIEPEKKPQKNVVQGKKICDEASRIGIMDTDVDATHATLKHASLKQKRFVAPELPYAYSHGTAVTSLLIGKGQGLTPGLPHAGVYAATVAYQRDDQSQGATLNSLLSAIDWLMENGIKVVNISMAGPPNGLLEKAIEISSRQGLAFVASVGNAGPAAPPMYPAAYDDVIAVTAVDANSRAYLWAIQGEHIDFAAPGVNVLTAVSGADTGLQSGTSFATPFITAHVACTKKRLGSSASIKNIVSELSKQTIDLGSPGKDPVFGYGLIF